MTFREKLRQGRFVFTAEVAPPKGIDLSKVFHELDRVQDCVDAVNVTELQGANMRASSLAVSHLLIDRGIEPIFQLTASARNRLAVQAEVLSAYLLGIRNILLLGGDPPSAGDHKDAKPVYDLDTIGLFKTVRTLKSGRDLAGHALEGTPKDFFVGGALNPGASDFEAERKKMREKIEHGCEFFQTQAIFEPREFVKFINRIAPIQVPVIAGVILLKSAKMARYMNEHVPGISVPESLIQEIDEANDKEKKAVEIAMRLIEGLKPYVQGIHLMPVGWSHLVREIITEVGVFDADHRGTD